MVVKVKTPKRLAALLLKLKKAKAVYEKVTKQEEAAKKVKTDLEERILLELNKQNLDSLSALGLTVSRITVDIIEAVTWDTLYKYIKKYNAFDLLQKRVAVTAVIERRDAGKTVQGVKLGRLKRLSVHKSKRGM
jgi:Asp-tRNA(Asn)/Glu-tRNA(Gln) amidotransferase B subunit